MQGDPLMAGENLHDPRGAEATLTTAHTGTNPEFDAVEGSRTVMHGVEHLRLGHQFTAADNPGPLRIAVYPKASAAR